MIEITSNPIVYDSVISSVERDENGAIVVFVGSVRDISNDGKKVSFLEINRDCSNAEERLYDIASEVRGRWNLEDIAISRRVGKLKVGELALVVAVSAVHRQEAFEACQYAVDMIKQGGVTSERDLYE
jgi:molybdopterin synthase catalytic subunit